MSKETDIKIGLSFLDEYEQEFENRIGNYIAVQKSIRLLSSLGGPFSGEAGRFGSWISSMEEKLNLAERKLTDSNEGLAKLYFLRAVNEAVLGDSSISKRRRRVIEFYNQALELGYKPESRIYYRMAVTNQVLEGKKEDIISNYEKVVDLAGIDSKLGIESAKEIEKLKAQTGGGCFIATAVYDSYEAPEVLILREFRDDVLLTSTLGKIFVKFYYFVSPPFSDFLRNKSKLKVLFRENILAPFVKYVENNLNK
ncbi:MAG: CFI-box-CTERM domain-containing protein [Candidatus Celaenobacter antarcticus]|nr:CFI-box-CTERM domain-containing protein [Candidatus Celaenobacter antarcticus]